MAYPRYNFYGSPLSQAAAAKAHENESMLAAAKAQAQGQAQAAANQSVPGAQAQVLSTLFSQPANFANSLAQAYGGMAQGLGGIGAGIGNAFSGYAGGMGNVAQAMANERSNFYGANAMAEAARQGAAGNIGAAALGAYGGASNAALGAWGTNQTAYNKAMADMAMSNQQALSNYGVGRNAALGNLGDAYASAGKGFAGAGAISDLNLSAGFGGGGGGGGGFSASGPNGPIASGSYGGGGGGDGFFINASRKTDAGGPGQFAAPTFAGLDRLQDNMMSDDVTSALTRNYATGMGSLNNQHMSSREQPSQMLNQALQGLMTLGRQGYGSVDRGMDQFYATQNDPANRADFSPVLRGLSSGFSDASSQFGTLADQIGRGYENTASQMGGMLDGLRGDADPVVRRIINRNPSPAMLAERYRVEDMRLARGEELRRRRIRQGRGSRAARNRVPA